MPLRYKKDFNLLDALKAKGYTTYKLRHEKILSESTLQKLRTQKGVDWKNIETLCRLLHCQPADFMEYIPDEKQAEEQTPS